MTTAAIKSPDRKDCPLVGDQPALAASCYRMAWKLAMKQAARSGAAEGSDEAEAILDDAMTGLIEAARIFDPSRGLKFSTIAHTAIRNRICWAGRRRRALAARAGTARRVPTHDDWAEMVPARDESVASPGPTLESLLIGLEWRTADVLRRRAAGETLEAIGRRHKITKERARQIANMAIRRLKAVYGA